MSAIDAASVALLVVALLLNTMAGLFKFLQKLNAGIESGNIPPQDQQSRFLGRLYTRKGGRNQELVYSLWHLPLTKRFMLGPIEQEALPLLLRQLALFLLGVIAIARFASGEPILRLF